MSGHTAMARGSQNQLTPDQSPPMNRRTNRSRLPVWLVLPDAFMLGVIVLIPAGLAIWFAMSDLDQYTLRHWQDAPFIAFRNFGEALTQTDLMNGIRLSLIFALVSMILAIPLGVLAALATHTAFRGRGLIRSIFLVPYVLPQFVVGTVARSVLQPDGVVNTLLGSKGTLWLTGPNTIHALIMVNLWATWPFVYLLTLSGLQSIPVEVHEAAALDGSSWWQKLTHVILPYLKSSVGLAALISMLHYFNSYTLPAVMFGIPAPKDAEVLSTLTFTTTFTTFRFGLGGAMAIISLILILIPLLVYLRAIKLDTGDDD